MVGQDGGRVEGDGSGLGARGVADLELELAAPASRRPVADDLLDGAADGARFMHGSRVPQRRHPCRCPSARGRGSDGPTSPLPAGTPYVLMTDLVTLVSQIDATWFGSGLSVSIKECLAGMAREYEAPARARLLREGDETRELSVLIAGPRGPHRARRRARLGDAHDRRARRRLRLVRADLAVSCHLDASVSLEPVRVIAFDAALLRERVRSDCELTAGIYPKVLEALARRLRRDAPPAPRPLRLRADRALVTTSEHDPRRLDEQSAPGCPRRPRPASSCCCARMVAGSSGPTVRDGAIVYDEVGSRRGPARRRRVTSRRRAATGSGAHDGERRARPSTSPPRRRPGRPTRTPPACPSPRPRAHGERITYGERGP